MPSAGIKGNRGGKKGRSGRKTRAEELEMQRLLAECWTEADRRACIKKLARLARAKGSEFSIEAVKLLMAYAYGKPVDRREVNGPEGAPLQPVVNVILETIDKIYGKDASD